MIQGGFGTGGAEKIMAAIGAHRHAQGDEVHVAGMFMPPAGPFFHYPPDVRLHLLADGARPDKLLHLRRLAAIRGLIRRVQPDVTLSFLTKVNCLTMLAARGTSIPVVISERNNPLMQSPGFWNRAQQVLAHGAAGIVMQTRGQHDDLSPALQERAVVIPNFCDAVPFRRASPGPDCHFVAAGRLDRQKGFDLLIRAFARVPHLGARLTIFGEGPERAPLENLVRASGLEGRVSLPGIVRGPQEWLGAGHVLVVSSRFEGFSNVVAEATCSGLPVVSFDCPYGPSEMIVEGRNGFLVPPGDVAALAGAMTRLAADPALRNRLGQAAHIAAARFEQGRIMAQWDAVLGAALQPRRAAMAWSS
ncbi:hypothetical protein CK240_08705 [Paracoccus salipaludis]|uniref:Glycosyltransferase subfamily 4-like N-terminal domain-containing protein n=2 Tax=Paracoccus salipaludis TaxID=2032623 RepID=A0A2A2GL07_9RHOB|nr:hypothetical protein CK240_08705 [Paracoccus salipaludis]